MPGIGFNEVVDLERLQNISTDFSDATSLGIIAVDCRGVPVIPACGFTDFCRAVREDPVRRQMCYNCDAHGGLQSVIEGKPRIYRCHAGLVDFSIPLVANDQYLGAVLCGQVRVENDANLPKFYFGFRDSWYGKGQLRDLYEEVPHTNIRKVNSAANMLLNLAQDMIGAPSSKRIMLSPLKDLSADMVGKNALKSADLKVLPQVVELPQPVPAEPQTRHDEVLARIRHCLENEDISAANQEITTYLEEMTSASGRFLTQDSLTQLEDEIAQAALNISAAGGLAVSQAIQHQRSRRSSRITRYQCQLYVESLLRIIQDSLMKTNPALRHSIVGLLNHLERNPAKGWTLNDAAKFLGVSMSHASRTFKAYTGTNFVTYVMNRRIERAKLMLNWTDMTVRQIAKELDFQSNYFSRLFKGSTGMTPSEFRALPVIA